MVRAHIRAHDLVEGLVGNLHLRPEIGIERRIADEDVDSAECGAALRHKVLQLLLVIDVGGDRHSHFGPARLVDVVRHLLAGVGLAARNDDLGAVFRQTMHDGLADAFGRARDERHFSAQIEE